MGFRFQLVFSLRLTGLLLETGKWEIGLPFSPPTPFLSRGILSIRTDTNTHTSPLTPVSRPPSPQETHHLFRPSELWGPEVLTLVTRIRLGKDTTGGPCIGNVQRCSVNRDTSKLGSKWTYSYDHPRTDTINGGISTCQSIWDYLSRLYMTRG